MLQVVIFHSGKSTDSRMKYILLSDGLAFPQGLVSGVGEPILNLSSVIGDH